MTHLIDKAAVIAEIERRKYQFVSQAEAFHGIGKEDKESYFAALASNMNSLLSFIDTLEVKEEPEFTVDDIMKLDALLIKMWQSKSPNKYEEILKQFKAQKG